MKYKKQIISEFFLNETALRPDEFVKEGGEDCEDWSLFTASRLDKYSILYIFKTKFKTTTSIDIVRVKPIPMAQVKMLKCLSTCSKRLSTC